MPGRILVDTTPLRESRDFRLLFTGQLISVIGTQLTVVAIPYQVYSMTHSTLQVGAISLAQLVPVPRRGAVGRADRRCGRQATDHGVDVRRPDADQRRHGGQRRRGPPVARSCSTSSAPSPPASSASRALPASAAVPGHGGAPASLGRRRHDPDRLPGRRHRRARRSPASCSASGSRSSTGSTPPPSSWPPSPRPCCARSRRRTTPAASRPWRSTKEGLRYLRSRQALQGVYLIDINAMVFGMPRALFPAMAGAVFGGGHHHPRASSTPPRASAPSSAR